MGPLACEAMRARTYKSPQANSTSSAGVSPLRLRAHVRILPRQPTCWFKIMRAQAAVSAAAHSALDGPMLAIRQNDMALAMGPWPHARPCTQELTSHRRPTIPLGKGLPIQTAGSCNSASAAILLV